MEAGKDPKQGTKHGGDQPADRKATSEPHVTVDTPSVTPEEQPFVRQPVAEFGDLRQPGTASGTIESSTPNSSSEGTWRKEAVDSRTYTPWSERPTLQKFIDIPYELKNRIIEAFTPLPSRSLGELKDRAKVLLELVEPEISQIAHKDLVTLVSDAAERLHSNPRARVQDLVNIFSNNRAKNRDESFVVKIRQKGDSLEIRITTNSWHKGPLKDFDMELSRVKTRQIIATVIRVGETLNQAEYAPNHLKVVVGSALGQRDGLMHYLWEVLPGDLYRVGFQIGREIKLASKGGGGI